MSHGKYGATQTTMKMAAEYIAGLYEKAAMGNCLDNLASSDVMNYMAYLFDSGNPDIYSMTQEHISKTDKVITYRFTDDSIVLMNWSTKDKYQFSVEVK